MRELFSWRVSFSYFDTRFVAGVNLDVQSSRLKTAAKLAQRFEPYLLSKKSQPSRRSLILSDPEDLPQHQVKRSAFRGRQSLHGKMNQMGFV